MPGNILLSTSYLPPVEYLSLIYRADKVTIEKEESYLKQTYRNRCRILTAGGIMNLTVPVMKGDQKNPATKDITIDYTKRWQQVHLRAMISSYNSSPYFQYYFEEFEKIIIKPYKYLIDLNNDLLALILKILDINRTITFSTVFEPLNLHVNDYRYNIAPKSLYSYNGKMYYQVFAKEGFVPRLSIIDLIYNMGPGSTELL